MGMFDSLTSGLTNLMSGGAYNKIGSAAGSIDPFGSGSRSVYAGQLAALIGDPNAATKTPLFGMQTQADRDIYKAAGISDVSGALGMMSPFRTQLAGTTFMDYISPLMQIAGATSAGASAQAQIKLGQAGQREQMAGEAGQMLGFLGGTFGGGGGIGSIGSVGEMGGDIGDVGTYSGAVENAFDMGGYQV